MDSFMKDLSAATSGASQAAAPGSTHSPAIQEFMSVSKSTRKGGDADAAAGAPPVAAPAPSPGLGPSGAMQPTPEQQKQMLGFLEGLEAMKDTDPAAYAATMQQLTGAAPGQTGKEGQPGGDVASIMAAVQNMRTGDDSDPAGAGAGAAGIQMPDSKPAPVGISITPEPGFTFKTRKMGDDSADGKIFVNICQHEKLSKPALKKRLNEDGEEVEGMNIPMSVGAGRGAADKSGVACTVYDIIVNPDVVEEAGTDRSGKYRDFVCQLGMQCIEQKYKLTLDRRYKLPKLKYIGEVESQTIQDRSKMPGIEEVSKDSPTARKATAARLKKEQDTAKAAAAAASAMELELSYSTVWTLSGATEGEGAASSDRAVDLSHSDYREAMLEPDADVDGIAFTAEVEAYDVDISRVDVRVSPYRLFVKVPGFKPVSLYLPCTVHAVGIKCSLHRREGFAGLVDLRVHLPLDRGEWRETVDPGSKPWLLSHALSSGEAGSNPYDDSADRPAANAAEVGEVKEESPKDRFHLNVPESVDAYSTNTQAADDGELPEDRFHKTDATSQYHIGQRESAVQDKWDKHAADKKEREENPDPNVEYIDMDEYKPGGKRGPELSEVSAKVMQDAEAEEGGVQGDLMKAAEVVAALAPKNEAVEGLSSNLWAELI